MKASFKRFFAAFLATLTLFSISATALSNGGDANGHQRHPGLTADGALLADYLADELQYLTYDGHEYTYYDGKLILFPASYEPLRPEQQAVLIKGYSPALPRGIMPLSIGSTGDLTNNGRVQHDDTAWPSWGDRYTIATGGNDYHAFCSNINQSAPGTQSNRPITDISGTVDWRVRRALWFGRGGPGELSHLGANNLVVSTTRLIGHFNGSNTLNDPATSASTSIRAIYDAVINGDEIPGRSEWRVFEVSTGSGQQNVIFGYHEPLPAVGSLRIIKTVTAGESSAGFQFDVTRASDNFYIGRFTTNAAGNIYVSNLEPGNYTITEIVPSGWVLDSQNPQTVTVVAGQTGTAAPGRTFHNVRQTGGIIIQKVCSNSAFRTRNMAGAVFEIRDASNAVVATLTTNAAGRATATGLQLGAYSVREITSPTGYQVNTATFNVTLSAASLEVTVNIPQEPQRGRIAVQKTSPAGDNAFRTHNMAGAVFHIRADHAITRPDGTVIHANNALVATITTNADGWARTADLPLGRYRVYETSAPTAWQINNAVHTVTLSPQAQTVLIHDTTQNHEQRAQRGRIVVEKHITNPYYATHDMAGAVFNVRATSAITRPDGSVIFSADALVTTITTNAAGRGESVDIPLGAYRVYEVTAPFSYQINTTVFNVNLTPVAQSELRRIVTVDVPQRAQTGKITVIKRDAQTGDTAQGDATLEGAVFAIVAAEEIRRFPTNEIIYRAGQEVQRLTVSGNPATAVSRELPLGRYEVVESVRPYGYMPDIPHTGGYFGRQSAWPMPWQRPGIEGTAPTRWPVHITRPDQTVAIGYHTQTIENHVIEGRIWIIKHRSNDPQGNPHIERPLAGAIFRVFLTSAGSFEKAQEMGLPHAQIVTCDEGIAYTPYLPFGMYTVYEEYAPYDVELVSPFQVRVSQTDNNPEQHRQTIRRILRNEMFKTWIQVNKVSTNGARIAVEGVPFRLFDVTHDRWMSFDISYPTPHTISVFHTNDRGWFMLPEMLEAGVYRLYEQAAPYGSLLNTEPLEFIVHSGMADPEQYPVVLNVDFENEPALGKISVEKHGNMLVGVDREQTGFGILNTPVWERRALPGVTFNIIAAEDIITPCGTIRAYEGEIVYTLVTDENGYASTSGLFLGRYHAVETGAHHGFVLDGTAHEVTLKYADQYTPLVLETVSLTNERQRVSIELDKWMETIEEQDAPYSSIVFGLFAYDNIYGADGELLITGESGAENGSDEAEGLLMRFFGWVRSLFTPETTSLVAIFRANSGGQAVLSGELPFGKFIIRELRTADGYRLNDAEFPVAFEYAGQEIATVTVQANNGGPVHNYLERGSLRVIKTFEGREEPVAGVPFLITGETTVGATVTYHIETNEYGLIYFDDLPVGEWTVTELEGDANRGFILSDPVIVTIEVDVESEVSIHNYKQRGSLRVIKTFESRDEPVDGVPFLITGETTVGATVTYHAETNENGMIYFDGIPVGVWTVTELEGDANRGFVLSDPVTVTIEADRESEVSIHNYKQRGSLRVIKTFEDTDEPVAGVPFLITGETTVGATVTYHAETDENGMIYFDGLPVGGWTVTELEGDANRGFILSDPVTVTIEADGESEVSIHNYKQRGSLRVIKTFEDRDEPVAGVAFLIVGEPIVGDMVGFEVVTDSNGEVALEGLPVGDWTAIEKQSEINRGYIIPEPMSVTVNVDEESELIIHNYLKRGGISISKVCSESGEPLEGAEFGLFIVTKGSVESVDENGETTHHGVITARLIATAISDKNGIATLADIPYGDYVLQELTAPDTYVRTDEEFEVSITEDGMVVELTVENEPSDEEEEGEDVPRTGDDTRLQWSSLILSIAVIMGCIATLYALRKSRNSRESEGNDETDD